MAAKRNVHAAAFQAKTALAAFKGISAVNELARLLRRPPDADPWQEEASVSATPITYQDRPRREFIVRIGPEYHQSTPFFVGDDADTPPLVYDRRWDLVPEELLDVIGVLDLDEVA